MSTGKVKWFNNVKKYGFINCDDGREVFVHFSEIMTEGYKTLKKGELVEFTIEKGPKGEKAVQVRKLNGGNTIKKKAIQLIPKKRFTLHPGNGFRKSSRN